jgi:L-arabinose isomerase
MGRFRVCLVSVRFKLFDKEMPPDFPVRMRRSGERFADILSHDFDVVYPGLIEDEEDGRRANELFAAQPLDAAVFAPAMAAPPSFAAVALHGLDIPIIIWNAPDTSRLGHDLTQAAATEHSTNVGAVMYANTRIRQGQQPVVVTASPDDLMALAVLRRTVIGACAAGRLKRSRALRLGDPIDGYLDVEASDIELERLGVEERRISVDELDQAFDEVSAGEAQALLAGLSRRGWTGDPGSNAERSARLAVALRALMEHHCAECGTVNCHGDMFRWNPHIGISACLGVSLVTDAGRPLSCTGDQPTAICLSLARHMAGAALYSECYAAELETGLMLLAAGGEGDPAWASPANAVRLEANDHYPGTHGAGTSLAFALPTGPATLMSLSPARDGWILAWATGEVVETRYQNMRGPNGMFRFDSGPSGEMASQWIASGATHHNAVAPGRLDVEIPTLVRALGIQGVRV